MSEKLGDGMIATGSVLAGLAPLLLLVELIEFAVSGQWPGWTLEDGLIFFGIERPLAYFDATQFMLDLVVSLPLALAIYLIGYLLFASALRIGEKEQRSA